MTKNVPAVIDFKKEFPMLFSQVNIGDAMRANFEGQDITPRELFFQVKVPGGGSTQFEMIKEDGDTEQVTEISGVILYIGSTRAYHEGDFGASDTDKVPVCSSDDGQIGAGRPGGDCMSCPLNEFKSAKNNKAKACKEYKPTYMLVPGLSRPIAIRVSSGSFNALKNYNIELSMAGIARHTILTKFSLKKVKGTPDYSQVVFQKGEKIVDPAVIGLVEAYQKNITPFFSPIKSEPTHETTHETRVYESEQASEPMAGTSPDTIIVDDIENELRKAS